VETKLALNFKHRTTLFLYAITSLTRKNDKQIASEYNNNVSQGSWAKNKEKHSKRDFQKFHQNDAVGIEEILDTYAMHNLLERICKLFSINQTVAVLKIRISRRAKNVNYLSRGSVSRKARKLVGPAKPFLVYLFLKTERCLRLKLLA